MTIWRGQGYYAAWIFNSLAPAHGQGLKWISSLGPYAWLLSCSNGRDIFSQGPEQVRLFLHDAKIDVRELFEKLNELRDGEEPFRIDDQVEGKRI
jgi:hypothetical protein